MTTVPLWLSAILPDVVAWVDLGALAFFSFLWLWIACNAVGNFGQLFMQPVPPVGTLKMIRRRKFKHIVIVPCYIDPMDVLFDCLGSLLSCGSTGRLVLVVAFEKKTPDLESKLATVRKAFEGRFGDLVITVHAINPEKEIPGGCSNKNSALRTAYSHVRNYHTDFEKTCYTVTTCDTDTLFPPQYFDVLEAAYNAANPGDLDNGEQVRRCVWQPPVFYNWDLDKRPFFVRTTGVVRSMMMLGGLISFNLNPMSIFSYPLELGLEAGFINPRYSVDDIIFKVRLMTSTNEKIPVVQLNIPVISGPTIGTTYLEEISEWERQIRRWIVGSSESFHYFIIHWKGKPFFSGMWWFFMFFMYYAVLLCSAGVFGLFAAVPYPWATFPSIRVCGLEVSTKFAGLGALAIQYIAFAVAFAIDLRACKLMTVKENIHPLRRLVHWLLAPIVLIAYSIIAYYAVLKFVFRGKSDAGHTMAAKEGFKKAREAGSDGSLRLNDLERTISFGHTTSGMVHFEGGTSEGETLARAFTWAGHSKHESGTFGEFGKPARFDKTALDSLATLPKLFYFGMSGFDPADAPAMPGCRAFLYRGASIEAMV